MRRLLAIGVASLLLAGQVMADVSLRETSKLAWHRGDAWFGGWSGIEVTQGGSHMTIIGDRGRLLTARLLRRGETVVGLDILSMHKLRGAGGRALKGKRADAEGLAIAPDGTTYISFEGAHRVARVDLTTGRTYNIAGHPRASSFRTNAGFEALAVTIGGALLALPEKSRSRRAAFQLDAFTGNSWRTHALIPRTGPFLPVGADVDAFGRMWLLERAATPLGFRSRIRLFDLKSPTPTFRTVLRSAPGEYDNLEGISVWQDRNDKTRVTLISDDNFLRVQQTQIVEFVVAD